MGRKQIYTKEEVAKVLKETGYLKQKDIDQHPDLPSVRTILRLFKTTKTTDTWKELGIPFPSSYAKEEISKTLKKIGYLKQKDINQHPDLPSHSTVLKLFEATSMGDVWEELGIPFPSYTKKEVSKALKETGYLPQIKINQHPDLPSYMTVLRLFKATKMSDVWKELDIGIFGI